MFEIKNYNLPDAELFLIENLFSEEESNRLLLSLQNNINWRQDKIKIFGKLLDQPRLTAFYGDINRTYTYSGLEMKPDIWNNDQIGRAHV